jgi:hypothetical protein
MRGNTIAISKIHHLARPRSVFAVFVPSDKFIFVIAKCCEVVFDSEGYPRIREKGLRRTENVREDGMLHL